MEQSLNSKIVTLLTRDVALKPYSISNRQTLDDSTSKSGFNAIERHEKQ